MLYDILVRTLITRKSFLPLTHAPEWKKWLILIIHAKMRLCKLLTTLIDKFVNYFQLVFSVNHYDH